MLRFRTNGELHMSEKIEEQEIPDARKLLLTEDLIPKGNKKLKFFSSDCVSKKRKRSFRIGIG